MDQQHDILAAIGALHDRMAALEQKLESIDRKADDIAKIDRKVNAMARKLLSAGETVALGISDARHAGGNSYSSGVGGEAMAAKGYGE